MGWIIAMTTIGIGIGAATWAVRRLMRSTPYPGSVRYCIHGRQVARYCPHCDPT